MDILRIDLTKFRGNQSTLFTGRPQGEQAREVLNLDKLDSGQGVVVLVIPQGTTSFNPSFYLGLLYDSIKRLGISKFEVKYSFEIEDPNPSVIKVIRKNLEDGKRNAINTIENRTGLSRFLNL